MDGDDDSGCIIGQLPLVSARHINKRALRNKALSLSFNEKDLKDYVGGFHKRKKKRRKEAQKQIEQAERRKRLELRKQRKAEKDFALYGGAPPPTDATSDDEDLEDEDELNPVFETMTYEDGDTEIKVTTSEIANDDEEEQPIRKSTPGTPVFNRGAVKKPNIPVRKRKPFKKVKKSSRPKPQRKRDKRKGKTSNSKQRE